MRWSRGGISRPGRTCRSSPGWRNRAAPPPDPAIPSERSSIMSAATGRFGFSSTGSRPRKTAMAATTTLTFDSPPSIWGRYPRIVLARKPRQVRDGASVPRIEARLTRLRVDGEHLAKYRSLCSHPAGDSLPPAYPHVLAMPLHIAILSSDAFPVQVLGLVHVRNRIEQMRPVRVGETGELRASLEGHRDVERGQEFDLLTEVVADG